MLALHSAVAPAFTAPLSAFAPQRAASVRMGPETGGGVWDPLNLSGQCSEKTLCWYRHAELKHGRVAMAAFAGWLWVNSGAPLIPGAYSLSGATFESLGHDSFAAWDALPTLAKTQILLTMGLIEWCSEINKPHYMMGGKPGKITILGNPLMVGVGVHPSPNTIE